MYRHPFSSSMGFLSCKLMGVCCCCCCSFCAAAAAAAAAALPRVWRGGMRPLVQRLQQGGQEAGGRRRLKARQRCQQRSRNAGCSSNPAHALTGSRQRGAALSGALGEPTKREWAQAPFWRLCDESKAQNVTPERTRGQTQWWALPQRSVLEKSGESPG